MPKSQFVIIGLAVLLITGLYQLPKVVVDTDNKGEKLSKQNNSESPTNSGVSNSHSQKLTSEQQAKLDTFKQGYFSVSDKAQKVIWADSIAAFFKNLGRFDSTAYYKGVIAELSPNEQNWHKAGDAYFEAFRFATSVDAKKADELGVKTRLFYDKILTQKPKNYTAKANKAMTYVVTQNPMQGIQLLREILAEDANNQLAMLDLGLLAMQSGQYDKAIERFEKLLKINSMHIEAKYYLAQSYLESGKKEKAMGIFEEMTKLQADSLAPYREAAKDYLKQIK